MLSGDAVAIAMHHSGDLRVLLQQAVAVGSCITREAKYFEMVAEAQMYREGLISYADKGDSLSCTHDSASLHSKELRR